MRRHKYNVAPKERRTYKGVLYASMAEMERAAELDFLVTTGDVLYWVGQPKFRLGVAENTYRPDFHVIGGDAHDRATWAEDVKGVETPAFRKNKRLWKSYGPCPLRIIRGGKVVETIEGAK